MRLLPGQAAGCKAKPPLRLLKHEHAWACRQKLFKIKHDTLYHINEKAAGCQLQNPPAQGNVKVNSKRVALVTYYNTMKSQIPSAKLQINLKPQYSMTKTFAKITAGMISGAQS